MRLSTKSLNVPSAPRFLAKKTSAIPPAPSRRMISKSARRLGGGRTGASVMSPKGGVRMAARTANANRVDTLARSDDHVLTSRAATGETHANQHPTCNHSGGFQRACGGKAQKGPRQGQGRRHDGLERPGRKGDQRRRTVRAKAQE